MTPLEVCVVRRLKQPRGPLFSLADAKLAEHHLQHVLHVDPACALHVHGPLHIQCECFSSGGLCSQPQRAGYAPRCERERSRQLSLGAAARSLCVVGVYGVGCTD